MLMPERSYDVVVAGGSIAGIAAAAALREFGWSVLIVEPGQRVERRLAGELIHPLGVSGLQELGLFDPDAFGTGTAIRGFAVFPEAGEAKSAVTLPYGRRVGLECSALAIDYASLRGALETAARELEHVTFLDRARVSGIDLANPASPRIHLDRDGSPMIVSCRMLIAADGASSQIRNLAGIDNKRRAISTITGYVIEDATLPAPGFGHVMIGGSSLVLAYEIGRGRARVMFDQPVELGNVDAVAHRDTLLHAIPEPLRRQVTAAVRSQKPLTYRSTEVTAQATSRGPVVLVGDAGGSCHPLTATGMTVGICDALRLRDALRRHPHDLTRAFRHYDRQRRRTQRSRRMVASALHDVCSRRDPELRVVRHGLIRYWRRDVRSSTATMAILAMTDVGIISAFWQFVKVIRHGLAEHWRGDRSTRGTARLLAALGVMTVRRMNASIWAR